MSRPYSLEQLKLYLDGKLKEEISKNYKQLYEVSFSKEQNRFFGFKLIGDADEYALKQLNSTLLWDWNINKNNGTIISNLKTILDTITDDNGNIFIVTSDN